MKAEDIARKRVKRKKKFFKDLGEYTLAGAILLVVNILTSKAFLWSLIPITVFVVLIIIDYFKVFGPFRKDEAWELEQYEKELRKLKDPNSSKDETGLDLEDLKRENQKKKIWDERDLV